jgi:hypothetical protein
VGDVWEAMQMLSTTLPQQKMVSLLTSASRQVQFDVSDSLSFNLE